MPIALSSLTRHAHGKTSYANTQYFARNEQAPWESPISSTLLLNNRVWYTTVLLNISHKAYWCSLEERLTAPASVQVITHSLLLPSSLGVNAYAFPIWSVRVCLRAIKASWSARPNLFLYTPLHHFFFLCLYYATLFLFCWHTNFSSNSCGPFCIIKNLDHGCQKQGPRWCQR